MRRAFLAFVLGVVLVSAPIESSASSSSACSPVASAQAAEQAAPVPQKPATFKTGVDVVSVDVTVVDKEGRPVPSLGAADFEVLVDGRVRKIVSTEFLRSAAAKASLPGAPSAGAAPPIRQASSNQGDASGRLFAIVLDVGNIQPGGVRGATEAATRFIRTLSPDDRVGLFAIPTGPTIDFTADHERVIAQMKQVAGLASSPLRGVFMQVSPADAIDLQMAPPYSCSDTANPPPQFERMMSRNCATVNSKSDPRAFENCCSQVLTEVRMLVTSIQQATGQSLAAMESLMSSLARVEGPKTVVLISQRLINAHAGVLDYSQQLRALGELAAAARVNLYVLHVSRGYLDDMAADVRSPSTSSFDDEGAAREGLQTLAGSARGAMFTVVAGADAVFDRINRETSAYYLLGLETAPTDRDGKPHKIRVRLAQKRGLDVRSRAEFVVRNAVVVPPMQRVGEMLRAPFVTRGLSLRVATRVMPSASPDRLQIIVAADIGSEASAQDVAIGFVLTGPGGRTAASWSERRHLLPSGRAVDKGALRYTGSIDAPPGHYRLRLAALDEGGQAGSVDHELDAALTEAGPLLLGDVMLASSADASLAQGLSLDDTVSGGQARAIIQMIAKNKTGTSGRLGVTADVADTASGRALLSSALPLGRTDGGVFYADGGMDLRLLPPGDYYARATVTLDGKVVGTRTTPFHLVAAAPGAAAAPSPAAPLRRPGATLAIGADRLLIRPFDRKDVLRPDVVAFFIDRLVALDAAPDEKVAAARAAARNGRFEEIIDRLKGADETTLDVRFLRGLSSYAAGTIELAATFFRSALKADSQFLPAAFFLGACYAAGGNDREAAGAWQMALVSESDARIVYEVLVDALLRLREGEQAGDFVQEAQQRWPDDAAFRPRAAAVAAARSDAAGALDVLVPYIDAHPDDATSLFLAMRVIFQARMDGRTIRGAADDAALITRYAAMYNAAHGPEKDIVARWVTFVAGAK